MSDEAPRDPKAMSDSRTPRDSGRGGLKWLAGAAAAALLLGGGYYVWSNRGVVQPNTEVAAYDTQSTTAPVMPAPITSGPTSSADVATAERGVSSSTTTSSSAGKRSTARTDVAAEETVGVVPAGVAGDTSDEIVVTGARRPVWASTPSARRLSALYPARALERGKEGEASVHCTVQERGALECAPVSETPAHAGFSNAALRVARAFRHASQRADGSSAIGTPVNLRVVFRIADEDRRRS